MWFCVSFDGGYILARGARRPGGGGAVNHSTDPTIFISECSSFSNAQYMRSLIHFTFHITIITRLSRIHSKQAILECVIISVTWKDFSYDAEIRQKHASFRGSP